MESCGRLVIGPVMNSELFTGRLTIGRRLPTCPTLDGGFLRFAGYRFAWRYGEKLNEALLAVARDHHLLVLQHRLRQQGELLSKIGVRLHPTAESQSPLHALIVVGARHVDRQSEQLFNLLSRDERPLLTTIQQHPNAIR